MGRILDILTGIGNTLDVPGSMVRDTLGGENPFNQLVAPWRSDNRLSGRDLARRWGLASQEDTWGNLAGGIGLELVTDPLNVVAGAGMLSRLLKGAKIAKATQGVEKANALSQTLRAKGWMPEEVAQATKLKGMETEVVDAATGNVIRKNPSHSPASGLETTEAGRLPFGRYGFRDVQSDKPLRVYHETAAPLFEPHQFLPDPGTNNWMGKGTYFTTRPGEAAGDYSTWDKSTTIMPKEPGAYVRTGEPHAIIQAFRQNMPERYFKNITPDLERDLLPEIGATAMEHPQGYPKSLVEALRPLYRQNNPDPFDLSDMTEAAALAKQSESAPRTMMAFVDSRNPYRFEEPATLKDMLMGARATRNTEAGMGIRRIAREQGLKVPREPDEFVSAMRELRDPSIRIASKKDLIQSQIQNYDEKERLIKQLLADEQKWGPKVAAYQKKIDDAEPQIEKLQQWIRDNSYEHRMNQANYGVNEKEFLKAYERLREQQSIVGDAKLRLERDLPDKDKLLDELDQIQSDRMGALTQIEDLTDAMGAGKQTLTKGDLWALLQAHDKQPDEITDILRESGYDAIQHEAGTGSKIQERMYDIGREAPDIDEHSELVAFRPSQIYQPFIAPALRPRPEQLKPIPRSLKALLGGYQAGVAPARGRSAEQP